MPNGWRPTTAEGLLASLAREGRIQARNPVTRLQPLLQDVIDASEAPDNLPPNDMVEQVDLADIPVLDPGELPDSVETSADPDNVVPNSGFETVDADGRPTDWGVLWDFITEPDNPLRWDGTPGEAHIGAGRAVVDFTTGWVNNISVYSKAAFPLVAGARYQGEVRVKSTVAGGHTAVFDLITAPNPESAELFAIGSAAVNFGSITPTAQYQPILGEIVVPPNHHYGKLSLRAEGTTTSQSGEVSWDNVVLQQVSEGTVPGGVPWYAHPRKGSFDPKEGLYNLTSTSMTPGRLKVVATKADRNTAILVVGSSTVAGFGSPGLGGWPYRLLQELERDGCKVRGEGPSFVGMARSLALAGEPDTRWSFSGTVTQAAASLWASITNGSWAQFNATRQANAVQIHYLHTGGNFSYSINGGAAVAVTTNGSSSQGATLPIAVTMGTPTVRVTGTSATPAEIVAIDTYRSDLTGLRVVAAGVSGATSGNFAFNDFKNNLYTARNSAVPGMTLVNVGANDCVLAVDLETFKSNITAIIKWSRLGNSGVGLIAQPHANTYSLGDWAPYVAALYDVADEQDVPLLDMTYRWTDLFTATDASMFGSSFVHPGPNGHADYAHAALRLVY